MGRGCGDAFCRLSFCTSGVSWAGSGVALLGVVVGTFWYGLLRCGRFWALVAVAFCLRLLWWWLWCFWGGGAGALLGVCAFIPFLPLVSGF